ncbi:LLM class flavin-dependent oxidoreductase [Mesorhizobium sp. M7A.F.Ca.US.006.04.2.1]|uniref:LLM class flavin-dependent oxidoreductase n=1 Tax=unclassified Mesorhizobium TaxID=325217 RepID=UPI000FCAEEB7|nr:MULTISPECIES: LLM class flavin-dependent oxidoreductase [unclassified Mesorhizobium]RUX76749.1 LLM class flavin-dependent oxidoreductase [Mesorhizobium sp. M7A.F.Ca.US.005.03.1.1]RUY10290.1 LLM class flavin-dependent oxidoreductase [Mesorhizobium sp. M7A.F.Ca.US.005.03.2.1]RUY28740.1 LLM class flavin-dependent oxidoreductase [Mesorhizobium sp. M7A.F.Ca.US.001.04.2.1]RUY44972.1 LLM class flavin-dependent oxidoreductase [Mesorhizobium sp. M7A.F.Ca.US.001.04.1.1]RVA15507.1 LLM class flavin-dep
MTARQMRLGAFLWATGHHIAAWRHPKAHVTAGIDIDHYIALARTAETAKFDMVFCEDAAGLREANIGIASQTSRSIGFEPISLLSALAVQTSRIGLVSTASTSYNEPYGLARTFLSLDHLSGGRAGWNLVTSASPIEAANFGATGLKPHADRYERAREFAEVVTGLWHGKASGHNGQSFSVRDPLDLPRSPQGAPVMVQAGASDVGRDLAARTADVVFTAAQTFEEAKAFYDDLKGRLPAYGREPDDIKIMPGVAPVVAETEAEAREKYEELQELIPDDVGVALLSSYLSISDLWRYPIDGPLPELPESEGMKSRQALVIEQSRRDGLSIRQLARHFAGARGHWRIVGTAAQVADELQTRFEGGAADGFNVMPSYFPGELDAFATLVVPELQRRGLFRTEYQGRTLRDHLGLKRPV